MPRRNEGCSTLVKQGEGVGGSLPAVEADVPGGAARLIDGEVEGVDGVDVEVIEVEASGHTTLLHVEIDVARAGLDDREHNGVDGVQREAVVVPAALGHKAVDGHANLEAGSHGLAELASEARVALARGARGSAVAVAAAAVAGEGTARDAERVGAGGEAEHTGVPVAGLRGGGNDDLRDAVLGVVRVVPDEEGGVGVVLDVQIAVLGAGLTSLAQNPVEARASGGGEGEVVPGALSDLAGGVDAILKNSALLAAVNASPAGGA